MIQSSEQEAGAVPAAYIAHGKPTTRRMELERGEAEARRAETVPFQCVRHTGQFAQGCCGNRCLLCTPKNSRQAYQEGAVAAAAADVVLGKLTPCMMDLMMHEAEVRQVWTV